MADDFGVVSRVVSNSNERTYCCIVIEGQQEKRSVEKCGVLVAIVVAILSAPISEGSSARNENVATKNKLFSAS